MRLNYQSIAITTVPYIGGINILPKTDQSGYLLPLTFDWLNDYNFGGVGSTPVVGGSVRFDLTRTDFSTGQDVNWKSVYIDNTQIPFTLELVFPDTGYTIVIRPYSEKTARVYSNSNYAILHFIYDNASGLQITNIVPVLDVQNVTFICFDTDDVTPSLDNLILHRTSSTSALAVPALADSIVTGSYVQNNGAGFRNTLLSISPAPPNTVNTQSVRSLIIKSIYAVFENLTAVSAAAGSSLYLHQSPPNIDLVTIIPLTIAANIPANDTRVAMDLQNLHLEYNISGQGTGTLLLQLSQNSSNIGNVFLNFTMAYTIATYP